MCSASSLPSRALSARPALHLLTRLCSWTFTILLTSASITPPALAQSGGVPRTNVSRSPHFDVFMADAFEATSTSWDTDHMVVDDELRGTVEDLRRCSREFRRQWALLSRSARLTVRLRLVSRSPIRDSHAATTFTTEPDGSLLADVAIPAGARLPELLGHELEHVLERLDGASVRLRHELGDASVRRGTRSFETARAVLAGRMVAAQFHSR